MQPVQPNTQQSFMDRFLGVLKLDPFTWQGIKIDPGALNQAWLIVIGTGLISGLSAARQLAVTATQIQTLIDQTAQTDPEVASQLDTIDFSGLDSGGGRISLIIFSIIGSIIGWLLFAALAKWAARQFFGADPNAATQDEMRRLTGWAYAPGLLNVLAPIPVIGGIISIVAGIWVLVNQVQSVKTGMNLTTGKSIGASIVALILPGIIIALLVCACLAIVAATGGVTSTP